MVITKRQPAIAGEFPAFAAQSEQNMLGPNTMKSSAEIVEACMRATGKTPHGIARPLAAQPGQIYRILARKQSLSKTMCARAAAILGVEYAALKNIAEAERETDELLKTSLLKVAEQALAVSLVMVISAPALASESVASIAACILC